MSAPAIAAAGLRDGPLRLRDGLKPFYFRVKFRGRTFDTAIVSQFNLQNAFRRCQLIYPGADIFALDEKHFDKDGLPVERITAKL